jgi:hypothetical protein
MTRPYWFDVGEDAGWTYLIRRRTYRTVFGVPDRWAWLVWWIARHAP